MRTMNKINKKIIEQIMKALVILLIIFFITTPIHELGHAIAVKLTGGKILEIEYISNHPHVTYTGANQNITKIAGPIVGGLALILIMKSLGYSNRWILWASLLNSAGGSHDFSYYVFSVKIWLGIFCIILSILSYKFTYDYMNEFTKEKIKCLYAKIVKRNLKVVQ